ncbi:uracil phosphoribosyltransferase [Bdellovibrio sp. HCB337]|uniref:uracil phosphoribosyltransferase n=1 Tax=Bdellovibrio sp. HCB337 TaxID=3394358 RepID=UPI0039A78151
MQYQEITHHYGPRVHLVDNPFLSGLLAQLCSPQTFQPQINSLVEILYTHLISMVVTNEFDVEAFKIPTRMTEAHPGIELEGTRTARKQKAVCVNLARAGTFPSHLCYNFLHFALEPQNIRQDHIFAARITDLDHHVTGTHLGSVKIGGDVDGAHVLIPDPMGATGSTLVSSINYYKQKVQGTAKKFIALHLIVTPEYLKNVLTAHPDVVIYALRLDRGLSDKAVLRSPAGQHWDQEKGLNDLDYIVPGGGGFGEIMNNSFV